MPTGKLNAVLFSLAVALVTIYESVQLNLGFWFFYVNFSQTKSPIQTIFLELLHFTELETEEKLWMNGLIRWKIYPFRLQLDCLSISREIDVLFEMFQLFTQMRDLEKDLPFKDDHETLSRIKRTNFYCVRDDFLAAWREHEHFLVVYEEKVKKTLIRQAKISEA